MKPMDDRERLKQFAAYFCGVARDKIVGSARLAMQRALQWGIVEVVKISSHPKAQHGYSNEMYRLI